MSKGLIVRPSPYGGTWLHYEGHTFGFTNSTAQELAIPVDRLRERMQAVGLMDDDKEWQDLLKYLDNPWGNGSLLKDI